MASYHARGAHRRDPPTIPTLRQDLRACQDFIVGGACALNTNVRAVGGHAAFLVGRRHRSCFSKRTRLRSRGWALEEIGVACVAVSPPQIGVETTGEHDMVGTVRIFSPAPTTRRAPPLGVVARCGEICAWIIDAIRRREAAHSVGLSQLPAASEPPYKPTPGTFLGRRCGPQSTSQATAQVRAHSC